MHSDCVPEAVISVFAATCGTAVAPDPSSADEAFADSTVMAVISLVGEVEWTLFLDLPAPSACLLAAKFAGFEIPFDSADMGDAIGELANILAGDIKARLDSRGVRADLSLPSVLRGEHVNLVLQKGLPRNKWLFACPAGKIRAGIVAGRQVLGAKG